MFFKTYSFSINLLTCMSSACGNSNEFQERQTTKNSLGAGKLHHIILLNEREGESAMNFYFH